MKNRILLSVLVLLVSFLTTSCEIIGGIFKTGFGIGIFVTIAVIALVIYLISKFIRK